MLNQTIWLNKVEKQISDWLRKTGYPLELFVYEQLAKRKYLCEKSSLYCDNRSGVSREIDVTAYLHGPEYGTHSYSLQLLIECKKSEKPLIVLAENKTKERFDQLFGGCNDSSHGLALSLGYVHFHQLTPEAKKSHLSPWAEQIPIGYSIVPAFQSSDENIYKGVMGLASANEYYLKQQANFVKSVRSWAQDNLVDNNPFQLQIPVLVVDSPLFTVSIGNDGELEIHETDWACLNIRLPMGLNDGERICCIQVIRKDKFPQAVDAFEQLLNFLSQEAVVKLAIKHLTWRQTLQYKYSSLIRKIFS